ncbi:MAG TPA: GNAT family N-acetyltransferase [Bacteroidia bacterium]|jgi:predicted N-acetyltransferase YhbS|nr:GNAT family N-acetyltransferase [Bacteroidia bacterium]
MANIRSYKPEDYEAVKNNLVAADMWDYTADTEGNLQSMIDQNPDAILVAELDREVVGSIYTTPFGINVGIIWRLAVLEQHRRKGIASELLEEMTYRLNTKGVKEIWGFMDTTKPDLDKFYGRQNYVYNPDNKYFAIWKPLELTSE